MTAKRNLEINIMSWLIQTKSILQKDMKGEFRQKFALTTILLFSFVVIMAVSFALGGISPGAKYSAVLFWITILFSDLAGFAHIFVQEEEMGTSMALRLCANPSSIYWGKFFFNLCTVLDHGFLIRTVDASIDEFVDDFEFHPEHVKYIA